MIYFRTLDDYQRLRVLVEHGQRFAIIGGGFIGSEIAAALAMNQKDVVMIFPGAEIGARSFGSDLSRFLNDVYRQNGVEVLTGETVAGLVRRGEQLALKTARGQELLVDGVVAGIGIEPNTVLAQAAGLAVDNGIVVDAQLRTSHPDIYAAGDVANFLCTQMRGVREVSPLTRTTFWRGEYDHNPALRAEFFTICAVQR